MITSRQLRQKFLDFYASKGHAILPSSSLVPKEDPTVLFNTAGMQPIVPYLLGEPHPEGTRLVNSQKCIRTDDIEEIGDNRHATFFEMLGFWSLGDYFKEETIEWMFEFLTDKKWLGLDPKRLFVTVYKGNVPQNLSLNDLKKENSEQNLKNLGNNLEMSLNLENPETVHNLDKKETGLLEKIGEYIGNQIENLNSKQSLENGDQNTEELQNQNQNQQRIDESLNILKSDHKNGLEKDEEIAENDKKDKKEMQNEEQTNSQEEKITNSTQNSGYVESDEEAVVFWQKQFEKLGIYADVGEEFDFKNSQKENNSNEKETSNVWSLNFRDLQILESILNGQKTIETRALNPEEKSINRYFGDIKLGDILELVDKSVDLENKNKTEDKTESKYYFEITKVDLFDNLDLAINSGLDFGKVLPSEFENQKESQKNGGFDQFEKSDENKNELNNLENLDNSTKIQKIEDIKEIYKNKLGQDYLDKINKNGLVAIHLGKNITEDQKSKLQENSQNFQNQTPNWQKKENEQKENGENKMLALVGPSGSGTSTLTKSLLAENPDFALSVSCVTRKPRINEKDGIDYYFIEREDFENKIKNGEFVEWQEVFNGVFYGTLKSEVSRLWNLGKIPIFDIDYAGCYNLKKIYPGLVDIFLEPPSMEILEERLRSRGTETEEQIQFRLKKASDYMEQKTKFSYRIINRNLEETVEITKEIFQQHFEKEKTEKDNKLTKIFFASTNEQKITDFKASLQDLPYQILTLKDLSYAIEEPTENGQSNVENAQLKAEYYWQRLEEKMPVIAQDNAKFLAEVEEADQPSQNIKGIVQEKFGNSEPETMIKFYQELATKYGGKIECVESLAICLFDGENICNEIVEISNFLTNERFGEVNPNYPMSVLTKVQINQEIDDKINSELKFWQELSSGEKSQYLQNLTKTYQKLISVLESFNKTKVIFIHGGNSFATYEEYLEDLKMKPAKFNNYNSRWKETLTSKLGSEYQVYQLAMPTSDNAKYEEWKIQFDKIHELLDWKTILIGHSLGGIFLAKYLSENKLEQKILQLHLVASPFDPVGSFAISQLEKLEESVQQIYLYHSKDDKVVEFSQMSKYQNELPTAQTLVFCDRGHFLQSDFPELIEQIKKEKRLEKISDTSKIETTVQNSSLELEKPSKYIYRITKRSGKDNWWGLPYRGPCGPCSEVYYLLENNPLDFEQSLFPKMTEEEIEEFLESQIVEIGNNVFMSYIGEKDTQDEPINLEIMPKKNIDTGLGFERFLVAINGMESIYETDCLKPIVDVAKKWSRI